MKRTAIRLLLTIMLPLILVIAACATAPGSGNPKDDDDDFTPPPVAGLPEETEPDGPVDTVRGRLTQLGFDPASEEAKPRMLSESVSVSEEYAPLGYRARIAPMELFGAGLGNDCVDLAVGESDAARVLSLPLLHVTPDVEFGERTSQVECYAYEEGSMALAHADQPDDGYGSPGAQSTRAIAAGDFNGDDVEEGAVVYARPGAGGEWFLHGYYTERGEKFRQFDTWLPGPYSLGMLDVVDVEAVATDVDGNGLTDLVVAVVVDDESTGVARELRLLVYLQVDVAVMADPVVAFSHSVPYGQDLLSVRLAAGNFDEGFQDQIAVVLRSILENGTLMPAANVRYWVLGQQAAGPVQLDVLHQDENLTFTHHDGSMQEFITADVVFGDFDGDGFEELAFTGILAFPQEPGNFCGAYRFGYQIHDDMMLNGGIVTELTSHSEMLAVGQCDKKPGLVYEVFAGALDYDGGYVKELLANDRVFRFAVPDPKKDREEIDSSPLPSTTPRLMLVSALGNSAYSALNNGGQFAESTTTIATGDFDNDGMDEVAFYNARDGILEIRGLGGGEPWEMFLGDHPDGRRAYPQLLAYDNDQDGIVVEFIPGSHQVLLTEPMIIAVLIAPPYDVGLGQNPAAATTSFGTSTTVGGEYAGTTTVTSGIVLGKNVGGAIGPIEFEAGYKNTMTRFLETTEGTGYETTFTTSYTTAEHDAVLFTSFPYDTYDYEIVAAYAPSLVGDVYRAMLPRTPLERLVSLKYFDDRVPEGGVQLGSLFSHTNGDPYSYMTLTEKNDLREQVQTGHFGISTFLQEGVVAPPLGTGNAAIGITVSTSDFSTTTAGTTMDHTVHMSIPGNSVELSTGDGESDTMTVKTGSSMMVGGVIPATNVDERGSVYQTGMFTYMHRLGNPDSPDGQAFQVINFWVQD